jgi:hypothetical protein
MESLFCTGIFGILAFAAYTQSKKVKEAGDANRARLWMIVSIVAGAFATVGLAAALAG